MPKGDVIYDLSNTMQPDEITRNLRGGSTVGPHGGPGHTPGMPATAEEGDGGGVWVLTPSTSSTETGPLTGIASRHSRREVRLVLFSHRIHGGVPRRKPPHLFRQQPLDFSYPEFSGDG